MSRIIAITLHYEDRAPETITIPADRTPPYVIHGVTVRADANWTAVSEAKSVARWGPMWLDHAITWREDLAMEEQGITRNPPNTQWRTDVPPIVRADDGGKPRGTRGDNGRT